MRKIVESHSGLAEKSMTACSIDAMLVISSLVNFMAWSLFLAGVYLAGDVVDYIEIFPRHLAAETGGVIFGGEV